MDARLEYCGDYIEIADFHHYPEDEKGCNPYNCTFDIAVASGRFSGYTDGCECDYGELGRFVAELKSLVCGESKQARLSEIAYGSEILFTGDDYGHIEVSGVIYGLAMTHSLKFSFVTDQSAYPSFIDDLEKL